jgi:hypothetical protein
VIHNSKGEVTGLNFIEGIFDTLNYGWEGGEEGRRAYSVRRQPVPKSAGTYLERVSKDYDKIDGVVVSKDKVDQFFGFAPAPEAETEDLSLQELENEAEAPNDSEIIPES